MLYIEDESGIRVGLVFPQSSHEREAIKRGRRMEVGEAKGNFAFLEDVVIHKVVAGRPGDPEDIRALLAKTPAHGEVQDIKMDMMVPGNSLKALRPFFLLVWNEDYEEVGIAFMRRYAEEKKVCLMLNVRPNLIEEGPPEAIVETVRKLIREGAGKGRFVLLVNLVPIVTPVEHVHAAIAAARQFGRYPIAPDLDRMAVSPRPSPPSGTG
jgi:hypothetical protein